MEKLYDACRDGDAAYVDAQSPEDLALQHYWNARGFCIACRKGDAQIVSILLQRGFDANVICDSTRPLHRAIEGGHENIMRLLLDGGADINAKNYFGLTPLSFACGRGQARIIPLLVEAGAEFGTSIQYAFVPTIVQILVDLGCELTEDDSQKTRVLTAVQNNAARRNAAKYALEEINFLRQHERQTILDFSFRTVC